MNRVEFDLAIYSESAILRAIEDYREICNIAVSKKNDLLMCEFSDCQYEPTVTAQEFSNYVIDLMNINAYADH